MWDSNITGYVYQLRKIQIVMASFEKDTYAVNVCFAKNV
ncbi:MAG: hypothetical protein PWP38_1964 [Clostridiales bacterium]|jgi:hypothetical protein|nr:hypothetical protein [Clostridiales bacterium]